MYTSEELTSLMNLDNGGAVELFDLALNQVLEDIGDLNKDQSKERTITLKVTLKATDTPGIIHTKINCDPKLGPRRSRSTHLMVGREHGKMQAREMYQQKPLTFGDNVTPIRKEKTNDD